MQVWFLRLSSLLSLCSHNEVFAFSIPRQCVGQPPISIPMVEV
jgi:hypothetical protein